MSRFKKYIFNNETLSYETEVRSARVRFLKSMALFAASLGMAVFYVWIYTSVLGCDLPKTAILKKANAKWISKVELMESRLDRYDNILTTLQVRDNDVYRSIFGMNEIPQSVRDAGFGGVNRYLWLDGTDRSGLLTSAAMRLDILTKKTYVQSRSFDDVALLSRRAGDMVSCIPAVSPINPVPGSYRLSSTYGYRTDPVSGRSAFHEGVDFSMPVGNPIYVTGDGTVESVVINRSRIGYGSYVMVDHGFGYKTRYAHMEDIAVKAGQTLKRGEIVGVSGNTGKSTGPHLHYEVIYRGRPVNPYNYYDLSISSEEYARMISRSEVNPGQEGKNQEG